MISFVYSNPSHSFGERTEVAEGRGVVEEEHNVDIAGGEVESGSRLVEAYS